MKNAEPQNIITTRIAEIVSLLSQIENEDLRESLIQKIQKLKTDLSAPLSNFKKLFNSSRDALWLMDENQTVTAVNKATREIFGFEHTRLLGKHCWGHIHGTNKAVENCPYIRAKKTLKREKEILQFGDKWLEITVDPILDENGNFVGAAHITRDITSEKKIELSLKEKEKKLEETNRLFRTMADTMPDMLWAKDVNKRFIFANKALCENLLGAKDTEEPIGKNDLFFAERQRAENPNDPQWHTFGEICVDSDEITLRAGKPMRFDEYGNVKGKFLYLDVHKAPMFNEKGEIIGIVGSARDVTQQKLFEKILRENEARYKELFEIAPVGYVILDKKGNILDANKTALERFGYSKEELIGHDIRNFLPPDEIRKVGKNIKTILEKGSLQTEAKTLSKTGKSLDLLLREKRIKLPNGEDGILSASIDITKRKEAEKALKEREEQLTTLINSAPEDIVCFKDHKNRWLLANKTLLRLFDLEKIDYTGKTDRQLANLTNPHYKSAFYECIKSDKKAWEAQRPTHSIETIEKPDGEKIIFDIVKVPLYHENGERKGIVLFGRNITKLEEAKKIIEESEEKFRSVWENSLDAMRLQDENERLVYVNRAFCEFVKLPREEIIGKKITDIITPQKRAVKNYKTAFRRKSIPEYHKSAVVLRDGTKKILELSNSFIKLKSGKKLLLTIFRDVTEYHELIDELTKAKEKAEEINRIKTQFFLYMSHELRTPFMGIIGYAQLLEENAPNEDQRDMARKILKTSNRMIGTLSNILDLTKLEFDKGEISIEKIDVNKVIEETYDNFASMAEIKNLKLKTDLPPEHIIMHSDIRMLTSILNNLVNNAIKFTEKGYVKISAKKVKNKLILKVKDTGIGIPEDKQKVIWEEFRQASEGTTRDYQGSGIGLTIVKKYAEMFGGKVSVKSEINKGSTFTVEVPLNFSIKNER